MIIPHERLAPDTLTALIETFIAREGTDYGSEEFTLAEKVEQVRRQVEAGEVLIVYDVDSDSVNLLPRHEVDTLGRSARDSCDQEGGE